MKVVGPKEEHLLILHPFVLIQLIDELPLYINKKVLSS